MALTISASPRPVAKAQRGGPTVLIGFAEALAGIETAWSLQTSDMRVVAFTRSGRHPALRRIRGVDVYEVCAPEVDAAQTARDIDQLLMRLAPDAFLPLDDAALWVSDRLHPGTVVLAGPTGDRGRYALDKELQLATAREAGLLVPPTEIVEGPLDLQGRGFPFVVKSSLALSEVGGQLVRPIGQVCADERELARMAARSWPSPILAQPFVHGFGEGLFGHRTSAGVVGWSAHRRIRMVNPAGSASSACQSIPVDSQLIAPAERFLEAMNWRGLFMLEFLRDRDGQPWFMELNGRTWGSLALARRRGYEYPAWTVLAALDEGFIPDVPDHPAGASDIVCRHLGMELAHLAFVLRGPQSSAFGDWPRPGATLRAVAHISRNDRFYNWDRGAPAVLVADTMSTVRDYFRRFRTRR